jgi:ribosomal-protein-alanine N-acetyltransferase
MTELTTERLQLKPLSLAHAPDLFQICSCSDTMRYWNRPPWQALAQAEESIAGCLERSKKGEQYTWAVYQGDQFIGQLLLFLINEQCQRAEIGFVFNQKAWGKGFAYEACVAVLNFGFHQLKLNRIEAETDTRNEPCQRLLARLGFSHEGDRPERYIVNGIVSGSAMFGLLRANYTTI